MASATSSSNYITSASCDHPRYQSRSSMYIRGVIPRNFAELAEVVPIDAISTKVLCADSSTAPVYYLHFMSMKVRNRAKIYESMKST